MSQAQATGHVDLSIGGMTCATCAGRIERKLNKLDGVTASVNFATEKAAIAYDATRQSPGRVRPHRRGAGLHGAPPSPGSAGRASGGRCEWPTRPTRPSRPRRRRWRHCGSACWSPRSLTVPVVRARDGPGAAVP